MDKIVLGFSGGVDSAVSACLLRDAGWEVHCLFLDTCGGDTAPVRAAADAMGFPLAIRDVRGEMEERVCRPFAESYLRGETPNPCVFCNPAVKMRALCAYADELGGEKIATGHYVRAEDGALYMGKYENDQSYMLCRVTREQASRLVLPLGGYVKREVRALAEKLSLPAAHKPDSMEICFIPGNDFGAWLDRRGGTPPQGNFIYHGQVVGRHLGYHHYTLGQRKHFGISLGRRVYVSEIRPDTNEVVLSDGDGLWVNTVRARDMNWLGDAPLDPVPCRARIRHSRDAYSAVAVADGDGVVLSFADAVRASTPGQSAALYDGDRLLGGGYII